MGERTREKYKDVQNYWGDPAKAKAYAARPLRLGEAKALYKRDCVKCGCPLGFGRTGDGKTIPLDLRAPVYCVTGEKNPQEDNGVVRTHLAFVSHFSTCPAANEFSHREAYKNVEENAFGVWAKSQGWNYSKRGWPDFFCRLPDGSFAFVECKPLKKNGQPKQLKAMQEEVARFSQEHHIPYYVFDGGTMIPFEPEKMPGDEGV